MILERVYCTNTSDVDELERCINSEWAALTHAVVEPLLASGVKPLHAIPFVLEADILSKCDVL